MKKILVLITVLAIILSCVLIGKNGGNKVKYNNSKNYNQLITYKYSVDEFVEIQNQLMNKKNIDIFEIVKKEYIECVRHVGNIRYLLLVSVNNERLFIFFDEKYLITNSYYIRGDFLEQKDFEDIQVGKTTLGEVMSIDDGCFGSPFSALVATTHIVKEGVIVVTYSEKTTTTLQEPVVDSIRLYKNEELMEMREKNILIKIAPYILPIDKI